MQDGFDELYLLYCFFIYFATFAVMFLSTWLSQLLQLTIPVHE